MRWRCCCPPPGRSPPPTRTLREHTWKRSSFSGTEIYGKTVGVVGLGRIGQLVAQRLAAFGTHIVAYDPYVSQARAAQLGIELLALDDLLARADFISVHLPKTPETAGLIGTEALAKTKPGVIIVNAARGGLIDEQALADAIISGHVRGRRTGRVRHRTVHRQPAVRAASGCRDPAPGCVDRRGAGPRRHRRRGRVKLALAGEFVPDAVNVGGGVGRRGGRAVARPGRKLGVLVGALATELPVVACRSRSSVSWRPKMLRYCGSRRCAGCSPRSSTTR